jgi:BlaI family transcriptional regulator, penicillinase repressor
MVRPRAHHLTKRELEVMHVFWNCEQEVTAQDVRDLLAESGVDLTYTAVANLVRILYEKQFLAQVKERPFRYRVIRSFEDTSDQFIGELVDQVFGGSREQLFVRLVKQRKLSDAERALLNQALADQER